MTNKVKGSDIMDDYMFQNVMEIPSNCQAFLNALFPGQHIKLISVESQNRIKPNEIDKAIIMDIWAKNNHGELYDIEMQVSEEPDRDLRAEYYAGQAIVRSLKKGQNYAKRVNSYIIFIYLFNPYGKGYCMYTARYQIAQAKDAHFNGKSEIIYLNASGTIDNVPKDINNFLKLMKNQKVPNNRFIKQIKDSMNNVGKTQEWKVRSMVLQYRIDEAVERAVEKAEKKTRLESKKEDIKKLILSLRENGVSETAILNTIVKHYGDEFSKDQLEKIITKIK